MQRPEEKIYTVTAITRLIKYTLEESFPKVWVEGEISNYLHHSSGHRYLVLKDQNATIKLTIWRSVGQYLKFEPENGMKVRAFGSIAVYEKGGNYQLNVRKLMPVGVGDLEVAFRQLFEKLSKEGLFDDSLKKPLPEYPMTVGIVTSPTGAAIRDIINIARRRNDSVKLILYPAQVQGEGSEQTIIDGIKYFNSRADIDVVIIGRGGGSLEDLWAFNEEALVRAVVASEKPIVSGIGHEIDTTLSDLAADLRAPTPSAAAELSIWDKEDFFQHIVDCLSQMEYSTSQIFKRYRSDLLQYMSRPVYQRPEGAVRDREQTLDNLLRHFENAGKNILEKKKNILSLGLSRLESLSPLAILKRGYAVIKKMPGGETVKSIGDLSGGDVIESVLKDGSVMALVKEIKQA
ncbi:MAG: exodeoxyribonuclease VII large subunit [Candidatus Zixiibacteriota bacterium]|nr:MAG: exodeoxyribonuclease VII large subunit [candidate division Zixibacteria bacterium]